MLFCTRMEPANRISRPLKVSTALALDFRKSNGLWGIPTVAVVTSCNPWQTGIARDRVDLWPDSLNTHAATGVPEMEDDRRGGRQHTVAAPQQSGHREIVPSVLCSSPNYEWQQ